MPFGKIYSYHSNPRTTVLLAVAKANGLEIELINEQPFEGVSAAYLSLNTLGKIPTFQGEDGFILSETIAISIYLAAQNEKTTLLGKTKQDYAQILRWMSFSNSDIISPLGSWFLPLIGREPYNKKNVDTAQAKALKAISVLENHLLSQTFLIGERLTLADLFVTSILSRGFQLLFGKEFREAHPNIVRWYTLIYSLPVYADVAPEIVFIDEAVQYTPPKKEPKKPEPKKEVAPKAAAKPADDDEDEEDKPAPKPKHPLETLGRPTLALDDWKKKYSNEDTRSVALPWFWENVKPEEYSLWRVDYKYNEELTQVFMSCNLIGGFFNRLEASRKYLFGSASVYGQNNNSVITGAFLVRGQEHLPAFDVAPDFESYAFTKLDATNPADQEFVNDTWAWDKPVTIDGKAYEFADGKVFK